MRTTSQDGLRIEEPEYMPTANRSRWMRDYMKEYRQGKLRGEVVKGHLHPGNPGRREKLKEAHRLDSFKWHLSQLLSPQYEILLCIEYGPDYGVFKNEKDWIYSYYAEELCNDNREVMRWFPTLKQDFRHFYDIGGGEILRFFFSKNIVRNLISIRCVWWEY